MTKPNTGMTLEAWNTLPVGHADVLADVFAFTNAQTEPLSAEDFADALSSYLRKTYRIPWAIDPDETED